MINYIRIFLVILVLLLGGMILFSFISAVSKYSVTLNNNLEEITK